jgi:TetR/AcrR family acrAB operon transcriptional repressor
MIQRVFEPLEAKFAELQSHREENPMALLRAMTFYFLERVATEPGYLRVLEIAWHKCEYVGEMATIRDKHLECGNRYLALNEEAFRLARERAYLPATVDPRCAAVGLMAVVDGLVLNWTLDSTLFPLATFGPRIIDAYLAGLCAEPRPQGS